MRTPAYDITRNLAIAIAIIGLLPVTAFAGDGPVGEWKISIDADGQETSATLTIAEVEGEYSGTILSDLGEQELSDLSYEDGQLSFMLEIVEMGMSFDFVATIDGDSLDGKFENADMGIEAATTGTRTGAKVVLGSVEWLKLAREVLEELVAKHGEEGKSFSACEVFTDAPEGLAGPDPTTVAWHFRIDGKTVTVGEGEIEGADLNVRASYAQVLPLAKMVYTPEMIAAARANRPEPDPEINAAPEYLVELHNRLAVRTK